jgi:hypothetical protein
MKSFLKKIKSVLIASLVFVFSLSFISPALADVGLGIRVEPVGTQNFYYGKANNPLPAGTSFILMEQPSGTVKFKVDGNGKVYSAANAYCDMNGNNCMAAGGASQWTTSGSNIYYTTGNVGIGTTDPVGKLDVYIGNGSGLGWTAGLNLINGLYQANFIEDANILKIGNAGDGGIQLSTGGAGNVLTITDNGNVGIGTALPGATLEVAGQIKINGGSPGAGKVLTSLGNSGLASWQAISSSGIGGSGTNNAIPKFTGSASIGNSRIWDDGTYIDLSSSKIILGSTMESSYPVNIGGTPYTTEALKALVSIMNMADAYNATPIAGLGFETYTSSMSGSAILGGISMGKENTTNGNADSFLDLFTHSSYGIMSALHINSVGNISIGKGVSGGIGPTLTATSVYRSASNDNSSLVLIGDGMNTATPVKMYFKDDGAGDGYFYITRDADDTAGIMMGVDGHISLGSGTPSNYRLYVAGSGYATSNWVSSDVRWKKDINPLKDSLSKVLKLQGVNYQWNTKDYPNKGFTAGEQIGLIAQDTEKVIPELVNTDKDGYKAVSYEKLTAVLVEAMKEQQKQIDGLKAELKTLQAGK